MATPLASRLNNYTNGMNSGQTLVACENCGYSRMNKTTSGDGLLQQDNTLLLVMSSRKLIPGKLR